MKKPTKETVHSFVETLLARTKKPYPEIAKLARAKFHSDTSPASVRHYASKMRSAGRKVPERPTAHEATYA